MESKHRVNVTLKGSIALRFMELLKNRRLGEIREGALNVTSASQLIVELVTLGLGTEHITQNTIQFTDKTVSIEKSRGRFMIRFNPADYTQLMEKFGDVKKVDVTLQVPS